jgi:hypothetical protein
LDFAEPVRGSRVLECEAADLYDKCARGCVRRFEFVCVGVRARGCASVAVFLRFCACV